MQPQRSGHGATHLSDRKQYATDWTMSLGHMLPRELVEMLLTECAAYRRRPRSSCVSGLDRRAMNASCIDAVVPWEPILWIRKSVSLTGRNNAHSVNASTLEICALAVTLHLLNNMFFLVRAIWHISKPSMTRLQPCWHVNVQSMALMIVPWRCR
jgi:hypothetical protein